MSPAPQGGLEVERYIGSCLISQSARSTPGKHYPQNKFKKGDAPVCQFVINPRDTVNHVAGSGYPLPHPVHGDYYRGWAGVPLFCMQSNNPRRNRKGPVNDGSIKHGNFDVQNKSIKCSYENRDFEVNKLPITRLVIHTQGAPLIQAGRYNKSGYNRSAQSRPPQRPFKNNDVSSRRSEPVNESKATPVKEAASCDSASVASDESSANSENSLPRIIKPRKRRKKDRKPQTQNAVVNGGGNQKNKESEQPSTVATLNETKVAPATDKTYFPIQQNIKTVLSEEGDTTDFSKYGDDLPAFGVEQDDELTSHCQCRYCDPAGVIWDVDQRCYSPFLTPPPPTDLKSSYSLKGIDLGPALRRSWSEPSSSSVNLYQSLTRARAYSESNTSPHPAESLEVSSEIVTSPNGHRDIEIKFFSTKSRNIKNTNVRSYNVEE